MQVRSLTSSDVERVRALLAPHKEAHCFLLSAIERGRLGDMLLVLDPERREPVAVCYAGGNCVPSDLDDRSARTLADALAAQGRRSASIVGRRDDVARLWEALHGRWGQPRDVRAEQPLMLLDTAPAIAPDPLVRRVTADEFELLLPAAAAMFTAEVGVSPLVPGTEAHYRARIRDSIADGRAFARIENGRIVFKAEIGAVSAAACQLQGVWVDPEFRGRGLAAPGTAAVAEIAMREFAPAVQLYVNNFNIAARNAYRRAGFREIDTFRTIFF